MRWWRPIAINFISESSHSKDTWDAQCKMQIFQFCSFQIDDYNKYPTRKDGMSDIKKFRNSKIFDEIGNSFDVHRFESMFERCKWGRLKLNTRREKKNTRVRVRQTLLSFNYKSFEIQQLAFNGMHLVQCSIRESNGRYRFHARRRVIFQRCASVRKTDENGYRQHIRTRNQS